MTYLRSTLLVAVALWSPLQATAQSPDIPNPTVDAATQQIDAQRLAIATKRQQFESGFAAEDSVCYQRFAVNRCLRDVDARRTTSMADLQRQDMLLNDQEHKRRGADQIRRIEEKQSAASQQQFAERRAKVFSDYESRTKSADQRLQPKKPESDVNIAATKAAADRLKASEEKAHIRRNRQAGAAQEVAKFSERQIEAQKRREVHERQQAANPAGTSKSLPVPP